MQTTAAPKFAVNVYAPVKRQLLVVNAVMYNTPNNAPIRLANTYLHGVSAASIPSVLYAFASLGTAPALLFDCVGLYRLHTMDLIIFGIFQIKRFFYSDQQSTKRDW